MVRLRSLRRFGASQSGIALTEGLIVFPIMVLAVSVCVEFGYMVNQWNLAAKAMQLSARQLVVSPPATPDFCDVFVFDDTRGGQLIAADTTVTSACGAGTGATCDATVMASLLDGAPGANRPGLRNIFDRNLTAGDLRVTYTQSGLGYEGRPMGPVVSVRLDVVRDPVDLPVLSVLLDLAGLSFPPFTVTATTEDLRDGDGDAACSG